MVPSRTRQVSFISDRTGITSEGLGEALLNQFDHIEFQRNTYPFIDTVEQARALVKTIEQNPGNQARAQKRRQGGVFPNFGKGLWGA